MIVILSGFKTENIPSIGIRNKREKSTVSSFSRNRNNQFLVTYI